MWTEVLPEVYVQEHERAPMPELREAHLQRSNGVQRAPKHAQGERGVYDMYDPDDQSNGAHKVEL